MIHIPSPRVLLASIAIAGLCACTQETGKIIEQPRPVKVEQIGTSNSQTSESFIGTVRARQRAELGFESGGKIAAIMVDVGDKVSAGQILARLDAIPAQERLSKAESDRKAAVAAATEREAQLHRTQQLERDQVVSPAALESVQAQYQAAISQLQAAEAALTLARRDLVLSQIKAPFDGQIVARTAQPYADIAPGQAIFQIEDAAVLEVVVSLPDIVTSRLSTGQVASLTLPGQVSKNLPIRLEKLSGRADNGSQVQATFRIEGHNTELRTGTTVSVALPGSTQYSISIPASALLPGQQKGEGDVFILDTARQRVSLRRIRIDTALAQNGRLPVLGGIKPGEWIVVAGTPFLSDGQAATRFTPLTRLEGTQP
ncbi:efflux RND transporter periplasmic adaptor subunit [Uliginosibacterium gangwonense]|uniref:efflux RND transporter periplasmic adaptor subunit n=1 Tax=Uliginosibacterium gangwonense TaxID=392736 RepID=UPI00038027A2|nr:efflux RND transporter periplasmic adaptor subunit [Uliginosibacterium gangwonense]